MITTLTRRVSLLQHVVMATCCDGSLPFCDGSLLSLVMVLFNKLSPQHDGSLLCCNGSLQCCDGSLLSCDGSILGKRK